MPFTNIRSKKIFEKFFLGDPFPDPQIRACYNFLANMTLLGSTCSLPMYSQIRPKTTLCQRFRRRHSAGTYGIPHTGRRARRGPSPTAKHGTVRATRARQATKQNFPIYSGLQCM